MDEQNTQPVEVVDTVAVPIAESAFVETASVSEAAPESQIAEIPAEIPIESSVAPEAGSGQITVIDPTPPSQTPEPRVISEEAAPQTDALVATPPVQAPQRVDSSLLERARLALQLRRQKKILKIMELFAKHETITNDDVEKLLHASDSTATRYLSQLVKMGKVVQKGKTTDVVYAKL